MQWVPCSATRRNDAVTTARFGHSTVCIPGAGSVWGTTLVVVFGGVSYTDAHTGAEPHAALSDVAVLQTEADFWFAPQVSAADGGSLPEARAYHCAAAVDRRMYVFGGHVLSYDPDQNKKRRRFFNDLWCLDTDTWTWQRLDTSLGTGPGAVPGLAPEQPPRRDMATLTRAGPSCLLLFGGRLESGRVAGDAWVLDLNTHTWSQLKIPGPLPPPRKMHAAVYATNRVVIFGGERDTGVLDDLWTLKGADGSEPAKWTQIRLRPAPVGRFGHAIAASGSRLAVFGGCLDLSSMFSLHRNYVQCNELWVLDMATFSWHRVEPPDGVTPVSGVPLSDPALLNHLQQQAALEPPVPQPGQPHAPHPPQLLLLPAERMCHSLVSVGAGRLLLVGGRKRDGICGEGWWLSMGPDDLTPTLTLPPPEIVAAALASAASAAPIPRRTPSGSGVAATRTAPIAAPQSLVSPPAQLASSQSPPAAAGLPLLARTSAPPSSSGGKAAAAPPPPGAAAAAAAAAGPGSRSVRSSGSGVDPAWAAAAAASPQRTGLPPSSSTGSLREGLPRGGQPAAAAAGTDAAAAGDAAAPGPAMAQIRTISSAIAQVLNPQSWRPGGVRPLEGLLSTRLSAGPPQQTQQHQPASTAPKAAVVSGGGASVSRGASSASLGPSGRSPSSSSLPADVAASWDQLRDRVGLSAPRGADSIDPLPALINLGHLLSASSAGGAPPSGSPRRPQQPLPRPGSPEAEAAVARARRHLACCASEQLAVEQLPVLLADCQALLKARSAGAWMALEGESWPATRGSAAGAESTPPDLAVLATYVSSCSHPLAGLRLEDLRLGDVPGLLKHYRGLVLSGEAAAGAVAVEVASG